MAVQKLYRIQHSHGTTHIYAYNEYDAAQQFQKKYPNYRIKSIEEA
ncbi:MAG: hypothetical protein IJ282_07905 [Lachnospiraceae bacterium]|nr:hypothetical protein [Lachnospiraceae bacterium]